MEKDNQRSPAVVVAQEAVEEAHAELSSTGPRHRQYMNGKRSSPMRSRKRRSSRKRRASRMQQLLTSLHQALHDKLQAAGVRLSPPFDTASLILDAHGYIEELKARITYHIPPNQPHKGSTSNLDVVATTEHPLVRIETLKHGLYVINVTCKKWPGLLTSLLKHLKNIGLEVFDANVSCFDKTILIFDALVSQHTGKDIVAPEELRSSIINTVLLNHESYSIVI